MGGGRGETATPLLFVSTLAALPHTAHPTHHAHPMCPFRPMRWLVVVASRRRTRSWRNVKGAGGELWLGLVIGLAAAALPAAKSGRRPSRPRRKRLRSSDAGGSDVLRRGGDRDVTAAGCSHPPGGRIHIFHIFLVFKYEKNIKKISKKYQSGTGVGAMVIPRSPPTSVGVSLEMRRHARSQARGRRIDSNHTCAHAHARPIITYAHAGGQALAPRDVGRHSCD